ncbi:MAG: hypothetical protein Ct9H300mP8_07110 [Gammaproteobacteria bacterium]|nr:MAG: hypothetical protein Ct9H300mP8_07110 [Gammaproteobacteria bacterium]
MLNLINVLAQLFVFLVGAGTLVIAIVYVLDRVQKKQAIRRNFPVIGRFRYWFEHLGSFFDNIFLHSTARKCRLIGPNAHGCIGQRKVRTTS